MEKWDYTRKMENCMKKQEELTRNYLLINKLFIVCLKRGLKLIVENPFSEEHYLRRYWCYKPGVIDKDRRDRGDYYKKPTQYWFVNCEPKNKVLFEVASDNSVMCRDPIREMRKRDVESTGAKTIRQARSAIHPDYANRFIREFILD